LLGGQISGRWLGRVLRLVTGRGRAWCSTPYIARLAAGLRRPSNRPPPSRCPGSALKALRDHGNIQPGQRVLINGAGGGIGTFAVQIAKSFGADVTGVCHTTKMDLVRSLGADHVIDHTREDFTQGDPRYDFILDNVLNHSLSRLLHALHRTGTLVPNGGQFYKRWIASTGVILIKAPLLSLLRSQRIRPVGCHGTTMTCSP
jgi:Zinc-binding dehydrogenase